MSGCALDAAGVTAQREFGMRAALAAAFLLAFPEMPARGAGTLPPGFVRLAEVTSSIRQEIRYASAHNFIGRPAAGYGAAECWLRRETAQALAAVAQDLAGRGWRLVVYDCYRPVRAVDDFVAWAHDPAAEGRKAEFFPAIDKEKLFAQGFIARQSSHSTGAAVDVGAEAVDATGEATPLDFGTAFDSFDARSATASRAISPAATQNRRALVAAFAAHGFVNYPREWWHFSYRLAAPQAYDIPIAAGP